MTYSEKILALTAQIPRGKITTYKLLGAKAGNEKSSRACGNALNKNTQPITIPCHRVVKSNGEVGGYAFGAEKKIELLKNEGIDVVDGRVINLEKYLWQ
jgi:methylated-DNA-[protein]-cysteine S-methyltransferase